MCCVAVIVENQVGVSSTALQPTLNFHLLLLQDGGYHALGRRAIGVCRRRRDVRFAFQTFAELLVGPTHVSAQQLWASGGSSTAGRKFAVEYVYGRLGARDSKTISEELTSSALFSTPDDAVPAATDEPEIFVFNAAQMAALKRRAEAGEPKPPASV